MHDHVAVTTFNNDGWRVYGARFVATFLKHWDIPLVVYGENVDAHLRHPRLHWKRLDDDEEHKEFVIRNSTREKVGDWLNPNMQSIKFCHKVFAVTSKDLDSRWRIWLDADVETVADVNGDALKDMCPEDVALSYLGRVTNVHPGQRPYPECGFVGYRTEDDAIKTMLAAMRGIYASDRLYSLGKHNWHDSYVFDFCRQDVPESKQWNLSRGLDGLHVWPRTVLGRYMVHNKGVHRKVKTYGANA